MSTIVGALHDLAVPPFPSDIVAAYTNFAKSGNNSFKSTALSTDEDGYLKIRVSKSSNSVAALFRQFAPFADYPFNQPVAVYDADAENGDILGYFVGMHILDALKYQKREERLINCTNNGLAKNGKRRPKYEAIADRVKNDPNSCKDAVFPIYKPQDEIGGVAFVCPDVFKDIVEPHLTRPIQEQSAEADTSATPDADIPFPDITPALSSNSSAISPNFFALSKFRRAREGAFTVLNDRNSFAGLQLTRSNLADAIEAGEDICFLLPNSWIEKFIAKAQERHIDIETKNVSGYQQNQYGSASYAALLDNEMLICCNEQTNTELGAIVAASSTNLEILQEIQTETNPNFNRGNHRELEPARVRLGEQNVISVDTVYDIEQNPEPTTETPNVDTNTIEAIGMPKPTEIPGTTTQEILECLAKVIFNQAAGKQRGEDPYLECVTQSGSRFSISSNPSEDFKESFNSMDTTHRISECNPSIDDERHLENLAEVKNAFNALRQKSFDDQKAVQFLVAAANMPTMNLAVILGHARTDAAIEKRKKIERLKQEISDPTFKF